MGADNFQTRIRTSSGTFSKENLSKGAAFLDKTALSIGNAIAGKTFFQGAADGALTALEGVSGIVDLAGSTIKAPLMSDAAAALDKTDREFKAKYGENEDISQVWWANALRNPKDAPLPKICGSASGQISAQNDGIKDMALCALAGAPDAAVKFVHGTGEFVTNPPKAVYAFAVLLTPEGRAAFIDSVSQSAKSGNMTKVASDTITLSFVVTGAAMGGRALLARGIKSLKIKVTRGGVTAVINRREYTDGPVVSKVLKDIDKFGLKPSNTAVEHLNKSARNRSPRKTEPVPSGWRVVPDRSKPGVFQTMRNLFRPVKPEPARIPAPNDTAPLQAALEMMNIRPAGRLSAGRNNLFTKGRPSEKPAPLPAARDGSGKIPASKKAGPPMKAAKTEKVPAPRKKRGPKKKREIPPWKIEILNLLLDNKGATLKEINYISGVKKPNICKAVHELKEIPPEEIQKILIDSGKKVSIDDINEALAPRKRKIEDKAVKIGNACIKTVDNKTFVSVLVDCGGGRTEAAKILHGDGYKNGTVTNRAKRLCNNIGKMNNAEKKVFVEGVNEYRRSIGKSDTNLEEILKAVSPQPRPNASRNAGCGDKLLSSPPSKRVPYIKIARALYRSRNRKKTAEELTVPVGQIDDFRMWLNNGLWRNNPRFRRELQIFADELNIRESRSNLRQSRPAGEFERITPRQIIGICMDSEGSAVSGKVFTVGFEDFLRTTRDMKSINRTIEKAADIQPLEAILDNPNITLDVRSEAINKLNQLKSAKSKR